MEKINLLCSGYCSMDHIIRIDSDAEVGKTSIINNKDNGTIYYGGCSVNVAYNLAKLKQKTMPIIRVGDDYNSTGYKAYLEQSNIHLDALKKIKGESTSASYLIENPNSDHITLFYPGAMSEAYVEDYDDEWFINSQYALMTVASLKDNQMFLKQCKKHHVPLFLGMKMDASAFPDDFINELMQTIEGLFTNENEANCLIKMFHLNSPEALFNKAPKLKFLVVTKGLSGSTTYYLKNGEVKHVDAGIVKTNKFVDAVGSGDAYIAGFMYGYLKGDSMLTSMQYGATLASFVIEGMGSTQKTLNETMFLKRYKNHFKGRE